MTSAPAPITQARPSNDRLMVALGTGSVVLSAGLIVAETLHLLPDSIAVVLVIALVSIGVRILFRLRASKSSALSSPRVMFIVSLVLLGISCVSAIVDIVVAEQGHDVGN